MTCRKPAISCRYQLLSWFDASGFSGPHIIPLLFKETADRFLRGGGGSNHFKITPSAAATNRLLWSTAGQPTTVAVKHLARHLARGQKQVQVPIAIRC